jgi:gluconokinase
MVIIMFGVSGAGKTTVGRLLASQLAWRFYDADDFHPAANIEKMRALIPLSDADRAPWLEALRKLIQRCVGESEDAVLACSALKESYRRFLNLDPEQVKLVYLKGDPALIKARLRQRQGHFMNPDLLESQVATIEEPEAAAAVVDVDRTAPEIVEDIRRALEL